MLHMAILMAVLFDGYSVNLGFIFNILEWYLSFCFVILFIFSQLKMALLLRNMGSI